MRLGIDLDGVVADFNGGWMRLYNEDFNSNLKPEMVQTWDGFASLTKFNSSREFWKWARNAGGHGLFRHLPLFPEAHGSLERLSRNHKIVIITTKPEWAVPETYAWIADNKIPTNEVHITAKKWEIDCDVYLDDGPHNLEALVAKRPDRTVCRFVRPWNVPVAGVVDVSSWQEFEALAEAYSADSEPPGSLS